MRGGGRFLTPGISGISPETPKNARHIAMAEVDALIIGAGLVAWPDFDLAGAVACFVCH